MAAEILLSVDSHAVVRKNIERSIYCSPNFPECCVLAQLCLTLCDPTDCSPPGSSVHGIFQARNTGAGCHFLLQDIFPIQGSNLCLLHLWHWQMDSLPLGHLGSLPSQCLLMLTVLKTLKQGFPGGSGVKNLPTNAGDSSSIPDPGRSHTPRSNSACWPQLLSLCPRAWEPQLLSPCAATTEARWPWACAPQPLK